MPAQPFAVTNLFGSIGTRPPRRYATPIAALRAADHMGFGWIVSGVNGRRWVWDRNRERAIVRGSGGYVHIRGGK